jgi:hypothetical protein
MDCIDCHNRPSHIYRAPEHYIDNAMLAGKISREIPYMKFISMEVLKESYGTKDSALMAIHKGVHEYYQNEHPDYYASNKSLIEQAVSGIQDAFGKNAFPKMKVNYTAYPDHIGHLESRGCFRCHNDLFKTPEGRTISKDCNMCHTIIGQGKAGSLQMVGVNDTLEFLHPIDIKGVWKTSDCSECHNVLFQ